MGFSADFLATASACHLSNSLSVPRRLDHASDVSRSERRCYRPEFGCVVAPNPAFDSVGAFRCSTGGRKERGEGPLPHPGNDRRSPLACRLGGRLRGEAAALLERIDFQREFPYRMKRSFYWSFLVSLVVAVLFHLSMPLMGSTRPQAPAYEKLSELAERMAQRPSLSALAHDLQTLAMKLQQPNVTEQEKQTLIQKNLEEVEKQQKKEKEKENRTLLSEASSTLQGLEQQSARGQQKDSEKSDGGARSERSQEGQGEGRQGQGGGDSQDQRSAQQNNDSRQGKATRSDSKEQGKEKSQQNQGDGKDNQPDPSNKSDKDAGKELTGKTSSGTLGRSRSEEIPSGGAARAVLQRRGER